MIKTIKLINDSDDDNDGRLNLSIVDQYLESTHCSHQHTTQQVTICHCDVVIRGRVDFKQSNCSRGQHLMRIVIRKVMRIVIRKVIGMIIMIRIVMGMMIVIRKVDEDDCISDEDDEVV